MFVFSHNKYTIFSICLFLLINLIIHTIPVVHAQRHCAAENMNNDKTAIPSTVAVRILSIKHIRKLSLSSHDISVASHGKELTGNGFTIRMILNSSNLKVSSSSGEFSLPSPLIVKSKNPVFLKIEGLQARSYLTPLYIRNTGEQITVICRLPLEEYIAGVIMGEMPEGKGDALLAQAVVARSYALKNLQKHKSEGYDFCDCTHCQVYKGAVHRDSPFHSAAFATRRLVLMYNGIPVEGLYHSTCGGYTSDPENVYGTNEPGIKGIKDVTDKGKNFLCSHSPHFKWKYEIKGGDLQKILSKEPEYSSLTNIENIVIRQKDSSGRVLILTIEEKERKFKISGYDFWQIMGSHLGWGKFKSAMFTVQKNGSHYIFRGRGLGHGLGMCQWGAMRMAEKGYDFREILKHYFPDAEIKPLK